MNFEFDSGEEMALYFEVVDGLGKMIEYQDRQFLLDEQNQRKAVAEVFKTSCSLARWLRQDQAYGGRVEQGRSPMRREVRLLNQREMKQQLEDDEAEKARFESEAALAKKAAQAHQAEALGREQDLSFSFIDNGTKGMHTKESDVSV